MNRKIATSNYRQKVRTKEKIKQVPRSNALRSRATDKSLDEILSIIPIYLGIRWASIVDTNRKRLVSFYPEQLSPTNMLKNIENLEGLIEKKYDLKKIKKSVSYIKYHDSIFVYSTINKRYALIVNFPPDTPITPAEAICEHAKMVLSQILRSDYPHPSSKKHGDYTQESAVIPSV